MKRKSPKKRVKQEDDATEKETNEPAKIEGTKGFWRWHVKKQTY